MISPEKNVYTIPYKIFKNNRLRIFINVMKVYILRFNCNAFLRLILGMLNHLLLGSLTWVLRFNVDVAPTFSIPVSADNFVGSVIWSNKRNKIDIRILRLAKNLEGSRFAGYRSWFLGAISRQMSSLNHMVATQLLNIQTHHRGLILAVHTTASQNFNNSKLFFMPEDH